MGTGSPLYNADRSGPCTLIRNGSQYVLVDMGEGSSRKLDEAGLRLDKIAAICFTHHHRDHDADAISILPRLWQKGNAGGKLECDRSFPATFLGGTSFGWRLGALVCSC